MGTDKPVVKPLEGIRVLDLGTFLAAPFAATVLGEFGAEVIKIEKPGLGDPLRNFGTPSGRGDSLLWLSEARNKKSLTLDLRHPRGAGILRKLVEKCDVLCESFRPGTLEKWGLGFDHLVDINPQLIMLRVSGFGQTGPLKTRPGFARIAHAFGGLAHLTGMPGGPPLTPGSTSLADYISGLYGAIGILVALQSRERVGGQYIDLALYESIFRVLDDIAPTFAQDGVVRDRQGYGTSNACPHGHFISRDKRWLSLACSSDKMFSRFADLIGQPGLADPDVYGLTANRLANADKINQIVSEWMADHSAEKIIELCGHNDVPCAHVKTIADIFADEQFSARENLLEMSTDQIEKCTIPNVIPKLSRTPGTVNSLGPALGSGNAEILGGILGMDDDEIKALSEEGVI